MVLGIMFIIAGILIALFPPLLSIIVAIMLIFIGLVFVTLSHRLKKAQRHFGDPFVDFFMRH